MIAAIRNWAERYADEGRYSPVSQLFHWVMAALVLFQLGWGWWMGRVSVGPEKIDAYRVHAEIGLLMLMLAVARAIWRLIVPKPVHDGDRLGWQSILAYITHGIFYICLFALPLSGWGMWSAGDGEALKLAGVIPWPHMPFETLPLSVRWWILDWAESLHMLLVMALLFLIPIHAGAALKHHFWDRHDVLETMLPSLDAEEPKIVPNNAK